MNEEAIRQACRQISDGCDRLRYPEKVATITQAPEPLLGCWLWMQIKRYQNLTLVKLQLLNLTTGGYNQPVGGLFSSNSRLKPTSEQEMIPVLSLSGRFGRERPQPCCPQSRLAQPICQQWQQIGQPAWTNWDVTESFMLGCGMVHSSCLGCFGKHWPATWAHLFGCFSK